MRARKRLKVCANIHEGGDIVFIVLGQHHACTSCACQLVPVCTGHRCRTRHECAMPQPAPCPAKHPNSPLESP
eukprot:9840816-Alexandrium_andersonii.AAC.1